MDCLSGAIVKDGDSFASFTVRGLSPSDISDMNVAGKALSNNNLVNDVLSKQRSPEDLNLIEKIVNCRLFRGLEGKQLLTKAEAEKESRKLEEIMKLPEATYMLSNLGIINIPKQMQPYITDYECTTSNTNLSTLYTMMTIGNVGKLVITQNDDSKIIMNEIVNTFLKNGIKVQVQDYGKIRMDDVVPYQFEKKL
jgi:hypothetical protein